MGELSDKYLEPVVLCDVEGLSYAVVAKVMEIPLRTVNSRISRAVTSFNGSYELTRLRWDIHTYKEYEKANPRCPRGPLVPAGQIATRARPCGNAEGRAVRRARISLKARAHNSNSYNKLRS